MRKNSYDLVMKFAFTRHIVSLMLVTASLGCSSGEKGHITSETAAKLGREHAQKLLETTHDTLKLQYMLLEVRSREQLLRDNGHEDAADTYVDAFETHIKAHNDSLANLIF